MSKMIRLPSELVSWIAEYKQKHLEKFGLTYSDTEILKMTFLHGTAEMEKRLGEKIVIKENDIAMEGR